MVFVKIFLVLVGSACLVYAYEPPEPTSQILDAACLHAIEGSPHASRFLSDYFYGINEKRSGDFFYLVSGFKLHPNLYHDMRRKLTKHYTPTIVRLAHKCSRDMSTCFHEAVQREQFERETFLNEYFYLTPLGWPTYSVALEIYLKQRNFICMMRLSELLDEDH